MERKRTRCWSCRPRERLGWAVAGISLVGVLLFALPASARRVAREDAIEPLFSEAAFLDQSLEVDVEWAKESDGHDIEASGGVEVILWDRLEIAAEVPTGIGIPDHGDTVADLSDVGLSAQVLVCCVSRQPLDYLSIRAGIDAPTGDRSKGIGGDGAWEVSVLPGRYFTVVESLADVLAQLQVGYTEQIRLDDDQLETARDLGLSKTRQKEIFWNVAFAQPYFGGVIQPVFEILGTTIVDALVDDDEGTIVELGGGFWIAPHPSSHWLSPLSFAIGFKLPATSLKEDQSVGILVLEWALD